jgi:beta-glucanase (GH16 family)
MKKILKLDFTKEKALDLNVWNIAVGKKWANNEKQEYTNQLKNIFFNDEGLVLQATYEDNIFESARIHTKDKFFFKYGKGEIVAKVPSGRGTWPAIWMMPQDNKYGHWPKSGEIDIMEHTGNKLDMVYQCIHTEKYNHTRKDQYFHTVKIKGIADQFHTYGFEWDETSIKYYIDGELTHVYQKGEDNKSDQHDGWPFDQNFYLIMNMAVGGTLGGAIHSEDFPQQFIIKSIDIESSGE